MLLTCLPILCNKEAALWYIQFRSSRSVSKGCAQTEHEKVVAKAQDQKYDETCFNEDADRRHNKERRNTMLTKLLTALLVVTFIGVTGGFVVLAAWDVPVKQTPVEKSLETSHFLEKST